MLGDHPYITSVTELGGWVQKKVVFDDLQYCNYADILSGSEKVEICADVIYGWSLVQTTALSKNQLRLKQMGIKKIKQVTSLVMF